MVSGDCGIKCIGLVYSTRAERSPALAQEIQAWLLNTRGVEVWCCPMSECPIDPFSADLLITLGGDGTILRVAQWAAPAEVPILGINLGRVGFLTEAAPELWQTTLTQVLDGKAGVESRMMLCVTLLRQGVAIAQEQVLNDAAVSRGALARTVRLHTSIDGTVMTRYVADGLILATPTGSTAYAYAVGGPILPPWLDNIVVVPAAPHLSMERPIVLSEGVTVRIVVTGGRPAVLTVDGEVHAELESGDEVLVEASPHVARFARVREETYFYKTLVERLVPRNQIPDIESQSQIIAPKLEPKA